MSKIWEILTRFKRFCIQRGWRTGDNEDWVEMNDDYHNFLWTRNVTSPAFKGIISNPKCVVREGLLYTVVEASHTAWLFSEGPSEDLIKTVAKDPDFSKHIAIFDLSPLLEGKKLCMKLNNTDSLVFHTFETFLKEELKVKVKPLPTFPDSRMIVDEGMLPELS